jgi:hypothetical protein
MTARPEPAALTVMLAPRGEADEIFALLVDYAAAGMLAPFVWIDAADVGGTSVPATLVADGCSSAVVLQQVLTGHRYDRLRIAVLVPADAPTDQRASRATEQSLERVVRAGAIATPITLLRLLFTRGSAAGSGYDPSLLLEGWHNLLVAPEDSAGPGLGSLALDRLTDPLDVAQHVTPVVVTVAGLWRGIDRVVFDDLGILPGNTLRAVRAFYRELDATGVEEQLRLQLFDSKGRLPLPRSGEAPVIYVADAALATQTVARALWTKHRDVLRGGRMDIDVHPAQPISTWTACKIFFSFIWAALRNAPAAWLQGMLSSVSSVLATTVQHAVFGRSDSVYAVVTGSDPTSWQDIGRGAEQMSSLLTQEPGARQPIQTDLTQLWVDYVNGALTLADGGRRSAGIQPVTVGAAIGVLPNSTDVVPSTADAFTAIPASLAAVIGVRSVAGGDVLGAADAKARLQRTFGDAAAGIEARHTLADLARWEATTGKSYAAQVGSILADFLDRARGEVDDLVRRIRESAETGVDETLRRRQQVIATITRAGGWALVAVLLVLAAIAVVAWVSWKFALVVGGILLAIYILAALILFILGQRHLFAELNKRQTQVTEFEAMDFNLRAALQDVSRLSSAYGQLLAWNRVLGEVLRTPFGPVAPDQARRPHILDGVPRSVQIGVAAPATPEAESATHSLQQQLYSIGWLTGPWERMLEAAGRRVHDEPIALFRMPGAGSGSALDEWSAAVAAGEVQLEGANELWKKVQAMFDDPGSGIADTLTGGVMIPATGQRTSPTQFSGGILHQRGPAAPFDVSLFTDTAVTAGRSVVAIDNTAVDHHGLGYRAAVIQVGDGLPTHDFAIFDRGLATVGSIDDDTPPESGSLVF